VAGDEEAADGGEQLVDDLVAAASDAGSRNARTGRFPAAVDMELRTQRLEIAAAQRLQKYADETLVRQFAALGHSVSSPSAGGGARPLLSVGRAALSMTRRF